MKWRRIVFREIETLQKGRCKLKISRNRLDWLHNYILHFLNEVDCITWCYITFLKALCSCNHSRVFLGAVLPKEYYQRSTTKAFCPPICFLFIYVRIFSCFSIWSYIGLGGTGLQECHRKPFISPAKWARYFAIWSAVHFNEVSSWEEQTLFEIPILLFWTTGAFKSLSRLVNFCYRFSWDIWVADVVCVAEAWRGRRRGRWWQGLVTV